MRLAKEKNITDLLLYQNENSIQKVSFYQRDGSYLDFSYQEIFNSALKVATYLERLGVKKGDRVPIVLPTHQEFYFAFFGVILLGAVPVALYPPLRLAKLDDWKKRTTKMIVKVDGKVVLTNSTIYPLLGSPVLSARVPFGAQTVDSIIKKTLSDKNVISIPDELDLAFIQFSSGTTGQPKPVAISHKNLISNTTAIMSSFPLDTFSGGGVSWLPLYHDMGLVGMVFGPMFIDEKQTLIPPEIFIARPLTWLEVISEKKASITVAPNFAFGLCVKKINDKESQNLDLSSLKVALSGAEVVHPETMESFFEKFAPLGLNQNAITPVYGLAESTLAVTFSPYDRPPKWTKFNQSDLEADGKVVMDPSGVALASVGSPLFGIEVAIRDSNGINELIDEGGNSIHSGTVWIKGESIMRGYLDCPKENQNIIKDGWLDTGDKGFMYDHELYICGRIKETIIIRGRNIDPSILERSLLDVVGLREGCTIGLGIPNKMTGTEDLFIVSELKARNHSPEEIENIEKEIRKFIKRDHGLQVAEIILTTPSILPRTSSGKIKRLETKHLLIEGELTQVNLSGIRMKVLSASFKGLIDHKINQVKNLLSNN